MLFLRTFGQLFLDPLIHPMPEIPAGSIVVISQILGLNMLWQSERSLIDL